ncbi:MAG: flavin monoamine oxidase family protein [Blastocatellia bacterium]
MSNPVDRRDFIKEFSLSLAALALAPRVAQATKRGGLVLQGAPQNVVILGGGLAGLAAGYELRQAGHRITILEAHKFPGGRVRTLYDFDNGQYAEAGALSFPQDHTFTYGYATEFGLPLRPIAGFGLDSIGHIRSNRFRIDGSGNANIPLSLKSSERAAGVYGLIPMYLNSYIRAVGNPRRDGWPPDELRAIDAVSLKALLESAGASDAAIEIIAATQLGLLGYGIESVSAMDAVVTEAIASAAAFYEIAGGNDQLASALKKRVKKFFRKQSVVTRIEQNETSVTVFYQDPDGVQSITADRVICALPFPVLKNIEITPALPDDKRQAVNDLKMTPVTRTFQQFKRRVWEQDSLSGYGITDLPIQNTYSPTMTQTGASGILVSYTGGQRALDMGAMSERDRQSFVLRQMGNLFNNLDAQYASGTSVIWHEDRYAGGGFAYFEPGQMTTLLPLAQRREGRIHFAGEHTSAWHGWMNGALESGNRAAAEVNALSAASVIEVNG